MEADPVDRMAVAIVDAVFELREIADLLHRGEEDTALKHVRRERRKLKGVMRQLHEEGLVDVDRLVDERLSDIPNLQG